MLEITDRAHLALRWFDLTHDLRAVGMSVQWEMTRLPLAGPVGSQPYWLMRSLEAIRAERNAMIREQRTRQQTNQLVEDENG